MSAGRWTWRARPKDIPPPRQLPLPAPRGISCSRPENAASRSESRRGPKKRLRINMGVALLSNVIHWKQVQGRWHDVTWRWFLMTFDGFWRAILAGSTRIFLVTGSPGSSPSRYGPASPSSARAKQDTTSSRFKAWDIFGRHDHEGWYMILYMSWLNPISHRMLDDVRWCWPHLTTLGETHNGTMVPLGMISRYIHVAIASQPASVLVCPGHRHRSHQGLWRTPFRGMKPLTLWDSWRLQSCGGFSSKSPFVVPSGNLT